MAHTLTSWKNTFLNSNQEAFSHNFRQLVDAMTGEVLGWLEAAMTGEALGWSDINFATSKVLKDLWSTVSRHARVPIGWHQIPIEQVVNRNPINDATAANAFVNIFSGKVHANGWFQRSQLSLATRLGFRLVGQWSHHQDLTIQREKELVLVMWWYVWCCKSTIWKEGSDPPPLCGHCQWWLTENKAILSTILTHISTCLYIYTASSWLACAQWEYYLRQAQTVQ